MIRNHHTGEKTAAPSCPVSRTRIAQRHTRVRWDVGMRAASSRADATVEQRESARRRMTARSRFSSGTTTAAATSGMWNTTR